METVESGATAAVLGVLLASPREAWSAAIDTNTAAASTSPACVEYDRPVIRSETPCYGINHHRTPGEMAAVWQRIESAVTSHPDLTGRVVNVFATDIRYYGCAARGSAELSVVW